MSRYVFRLVDPKGVGTPEPAPPWARSLGTGVGPDGVWSTAAGPAGAGSDDASTAATESARKAPGLALKTPAPKLAKSDKAAAGVCKAGLDKLVALAAVETWWNTAAARAMARVRVPREAIAAALPAGCAALEKLAAEVPRAAIEADPDATADWPALCEQT